MPCLALLLVVACQAERSRPESEELLTIVIETGSDGLARLSVEMADTASERARGLSFRGDLPADQGMLFMSSDCRTSEAGFWMKDTSIPLAVAFVSMEGRILDIQVMVPFSTLVHDVDEPYLFALEVNQGWFQEHGVAAGDLVELPDPIACEALR